MDSAKGQRFGKPYGYRNAYMSPNARLAFDDRLRFAGISTSSNSSWTFSNSHDLPKPRKGRLCGIFLIGAVLVVALSVIAIGGLAFYIGGYSMEKHKVREDVDAKRQYSAIEITESTSLKHAEKISAATEETLEKSTTEHQAQTKRIGTGTILGISKTMQELTKGLKEKKREETTAAATETMTESYETSSDFVYNTEESVERVANVQKNVEILPKNSVQRTESDEDSFELNQFGDANSRKTQNGHARPIYPVAERTIHTTTTTTATSIAPLTSLFPPKRDYSDEPWRPIIPSYRDVIGIRNPYSGKLPEKVLENHHEASIEPIIDDGSPITFSKDSFDRNLRITPEYAGNGNGFMNQNEPNSSVLRKIVVTSKYPVPVRGSVLPENEAKIIEGDAIRPDSSHHQGTNVILISESNTESPRFTFDVEQKETKQKPDAIVVEPISEVIESDLMPATEYPVTVSRFETQATPKAATAKEATVKATTVKAILQVAETGKSNQRETTPAEKNIDINFTAKAEATTTTSSITTTKSSTAAMQRTTTMTTTPTTPTTKTTTEASSSSSKEKPLALPPATIVRSNSTLINPFVDDSRSSSNFNFGLPDLPILKQFHHLDSLFKSFSKPSSEPKNEMAKQSSRTDIETPITRFPVRTRQTTVKSYRGDDAEVSTPGLDRTTRRPTTIKPTIVVRGDVEVVSGPIKQDQAMGFTTEIPKLITLLPVRSNVNMMRPLRPRPKSNASVSVTLVASDKRRPKMNSELKANDSEAVARAPHRRQLTQGKNEELWVYHPSLKPTKSDRLLIVTPEPKIAQPEDSVNEKLFNFTDNLTNVPLYNTIENLLNQDHRNREANGKNSTRPKPEMEESKKNTSDIVQRIVKIMGNVAISTADSPEAIVKVNQTVLKKATTDLKGATANDSETGYPVKILSSHYKLNQAGVPILTRILNKVSTSGSNPKETGNGSSDRKTSNPGSGEGDTCRSAAKRCNRIADCPDAADEKNCTCADQLKAQKLDRKLCDGIVDCWDFTDEYSCEWCKNEFLCSNSKMCVRKTQICDGKNDCPMGDDERNCVTISPSGSEAETADYHPIGYLMVRKNGRWGRLCVDNFEQVSHRSKTGWKISDLGRSVCKALTFRDFEKVERLVHESNQVRSTEAKDKFYELAYSDASNDGHSSRNSILSFHETVCEKKEVVKVTCTDLECGVRPQAASQWSRIVGGGNAAPGSWPWQAALYKEGEYKCGGTLISENWLISAGHCFHSNENSYWVARLGNLRTAFPLPAPYEQLRHISKIHVHPQYAEDGFVNDISLLKMNDPVRFTDFVRPICLPKPQTSIIDGAVCTVVGWGQLSEVGWVFPDTLQEVQLPIFSTNECRKRTLFMPLYKITDDMFCASYERGGRDACMGDSGGPLMCTEPDGKWTLYGITSNGYGCGRSNRPGVYTKVSKYLQWISFQMYSSDESDSDSSADSGIAEEGKEKSDQSSRKSSSQEEIPPGNKSDSVVRFLFRKKFETKFDSSNYSDGCKGIRCPLGECLPESKLCDGRIQCSDGSDEKDCW